MKKLITTLFALAILSGSIAHAVTLNATKIGGIYTTNPAGAIFANAATAFRSLTPMGAATLVGRAVMFMTIGDAINSMRIQAGQSSALPAPAGWSDSNAPPNTAAQTSYWGGRTGLHYSTKEAACSATGPDYVISGQISSTPETWRCLRASDGDQWGTTKFFECPLGYTNVNGTCTLSNALLAQWPSDNVGTLTINNGQLVPSVRDPDNSGLSTSGSYTRTGTDIYNNPTSETITPNLNGGFDYVRDTQSVNATSGEPTVQRDRFSTDSQGNITHSSSTTYNNSTVSNVNTSAPADSSQQIDTSLLAKDATLQEIKTSLNPQTVPDISGADGGIIDLGNNAVSEISGSSTNLSNLPTQNYDPVHFWTYASGQCNPITFDAGRFGTISLSTFCYIYDTYIRAIIVFLLWAAGLYHAYYLWQDTVREMF